MSHTYAKEFIHKSLRAEIERLRPMLPDTDACRRCVENIEKHMPLDKASNDDLGAYLNLMHRTIWPATLLEGEPK